MHVDHITKGRYAIVRTCLVGVYQGNIYISPRAQLVGLCNITLCKGVARGVRGVRMNPPFAIALAPIADDARE